MTYIQDRLQAVHNQTVEVLQQMELLLQCCPHQPLDVTAVVSPVPSWQVALLSSVTQQDELWMDMMAEVKVGIMHTDFVHVAIYYFEPMSSR